MGRAHLKHTVYDQNGNVIQNASVFVYEVGTTTPVTDAFNAYSGGGAATLPLTSNAQGEVECWLTTARRVDLSITDNSDAAYYPNDPTGKLSWTAFPEPGIEVYHDPADVTTASHTHTHVSTTGQTADDHHNKVHTHANAGEGGTVAHSATTGQTANDHHTENHESRHRTGGADAQTGNLDANAKVAIKKGGILQGTRRGVNLIEGTNITLTIADDVANEEVDVTIAAAGGGGGAPIDAEYVVFTANATLTAEKLLGADVIMAGTTAGRPAAATAGRIYFDTDTGIVYRDTGAAWVKIAVRDHADLDGIGVNDHHNQSHPDSDHSGANKVSVSKNSGAVVGTRPEINLIEGTNVTLTVADDAGNNEVDVTIAASGGGGTTHALVRKTADESVTSSTTFQDDDHLTFAIAANEVWVVKMVLFYDGPTTGDLKASIAVPTGATGRQGGLGPGQAATGQPADITTIQGGSTSTFSTGDWMNFGSAATDCVAVIFAYVSNGATAGSVTLQWAQGNSDATATRLFTGSFLSAHKVA